MPPPEEPDGIAYVQAIFAEKAAVYLAVPRTMDAGIASAVAQLGHVVLPWNAHVRRRRFHLSGHQQKNEREQPEWEQRNFGYRDTKPYVFELADIEAQPWGPRLDVSLQLRGALSGQEVDGLVRDLVEVLATAAEALPGISGRHPTQPQVIARELFFKKRATCARACRYAVHGRP